MPRKCPKGEKKELLSEAMKATGRQKAKMNILEGTTKKHKDVKMTQNLLEMLTSH